MTFTPVWRKVDTDGVAGPTSRMVSGPSHYVRPYLPCLARCQSRSDGLEHLVESPNGCVRHSLELLSWTTDDSISKQGRAVALETPREFDEYWIAPFDPSARPRRVRQARAWPRAHEGRQALIFTPAESQ